MSEELNNLLSILNIELIEPNLFSAKSPKSRSQVIYGGQLIGQSMIAAFRTVDGRMAHSLHVNFLRPGNPQVSILYKVEALRDGKSYSTRRVTATQDGDTIFTSIVSFHVGEEGRFDHQETMPDVPPPEALSAEMWSKPQMFARVPEHIRRWGEPHRQTGFPARAIELRPVDMGPYVGQNIEDGRIYFWIKLAEALPDDPALHMCAIAYVSDFSLLDAVMARYGRTSFDERMLAASLDHAMWFHRPFRADEWLLYAKDSPSAQGGRALARGLIFNRDGVLVASVAQEASMRERR